MHDRFFDSTRGKIVGALRNRRAASAYELAAEFGLSPNAIRQQLVILERDGVVTGASARRGKTKPTVEFSLTPLADKYFPHAYDRMLNAVLRDVRETSGDAAVAGIFERIGKRASARINANTGVRSIDDRAAAIAANIRASGVAVEVEKRGDTIVIREHTCPYASVVAEHPECCSVIHTVLRDVMPGEARHTESLATGGDECRFEISTALSR